MADAAEPDIPAVFQFTHADTGGFTALAAKVHYLGDVQGRFNIDNAGLPGRSFGFGVLFHEVQAFNYNILLTGVGKADLAFFTFVFSRDNEHGIVFMYVHIILCLL
jgi:hypothetical protein